MDWLMPYQFLSDEWFTGSRPADRGGGRPPDPARDEGGRGQRHGHLAGRHTELFMKDGLFTRGHQASAPTKLTIASDLARKIFVDGDAAAGVQAFLEGKMQVEGDLAKLVAMQTVEPSEPQKAPDEADRRDHRLIGVMTRA